MIHKIQSGGLGETSHKCKYHGASYCHFSLSLIPSKKSSLRPLLLLEVFLRHVGDGVVVGLVAEDLLLELLELLPGLDGRALGVVGPGVLLVQEALAEEEEGEEDEAEQAREDGPEGEHGAARRAALHAVLHARHAAPEVEPREEEAQGLDPRHAAPGGEGGGEEDHEEEGQP